MLYTSTQDYYSTKNPHGKVLQIPRILTSVDHPRTPTRIFGEKVPGNVYAGKHVIKLRDGLRTSHMASNFRSKEVLPYHQSYV